MLTFRLLFRVTSVSPCDTSCVILEYHRRLLRHLKLLQNSTQPLNYPGPFRQGYELRLCRAQRSALLEYTRGIYRRIPIFNDDSSSTLASDPDSPPQLESMWAISWSTVPGSIISELYIDPRRYFNTRLAPRSCTRPGYSTCRANWLAGTAKSASDHAPVVEFTVRANSGIPTQVLCHCCRRLYRVTFPYVRVLQESPYYFRLS